MAKNAKKYDFNHPTYYNQPGKKETIISMQDQWTLFSVLIFCWLNRFKYLDRCGHKCTGDTDADNDLCKANWYESYYDSHYYNLNIFARFLLRLLGFPSP